MGDQENKNVQKETTGNELLLEELIRYRQELMLVKDKEIKKIMMLSNVTYPLIGAYITAASYLGLSSHGIDISFFIALLLAFFSGMICIWSLRPKYSKYGLDILGVPLYKNKEYSEVSDWLITDYVSRIKCLIFYVNRRGLFSKMIIVTFLASVVEFTIWIISELLHIQKNIHVSITLSVSAFIIILLLYSYRAIHKDYIAKQKRNQRILDVNENDC